MTDEDFAAIVERHDEDERLPSAHGGATPCHVDRAALLDEVARLSAIVSECLICDAASHSACNTREEAR